MPHYWIAVASHDHVIRGVAGGFAQVCHGTEGPLKKMNPGDWIIYYSLTEKFNQPIPYRKFTAIGHIGSGEPYQFKMNDNFIPWRRNVTFIPTINECPIEPLITKLSFIENKKQWGLIFRRGFFEVPFADFKLIASKMGVVI